MNYEREFYATANKSYDERLGDRCKRVNGERRSVGSVCSNQYSNPLDSREPPQDSCETKRNDGTSSRSDDNSQ